MIPLKWVLCRGCQDITMRLLRKSEWLLDCCYAVVRVLHPHTSTLSKKNYYKQKLVMGWYYFQHYTFVLYLAFKSAAYLKRNIR